MIATSANEGRPELGIQVLEERGIAERGRYDVFVTAQPMNLPGGVASPANALAII